MKSLFGLGALLFALLFCAASAGPESHELLISAKAAAQELQEPSPQLSSKSLSGVAGILQQSTLLSSATNFPVPPSKLQADSLLKKVFSFAFSFRYLAAGYLGVSEAICPSLRVKVIIFPFHHFW